MSLFPAYGADDEMLYVKEDNTTVLSEAALERELLASDEEKPSPPPPASAAPASAPGEWYVDRRADRGNLRVSTLYYPGRPEYSARGRGRRAALGGRRRARRYYEAPVEDAPAAPHELEARARELRAALRAGDERAALRYVAWSGEWRGAEAALAAAREAAAACSTRRTRRALWEARRRALPPGAALRELRAELAAARGAARAEAWLQAVAGAGAGCVRAAGAALDALAPAQLPRVLHACGAALRAAGLWERLVQLVELTVAMNFPPTDAFPPPFDAEKAAAIERDLADKEDKVLRSGLPTGTVWVRVERLRAAARWRAGAGGDADPQRRPAAGALGGVLRAAPPRAAPALLAALLLLARVPPLPSAGWVVRALPTAAPDSGEWLAALLAAARRLPAAHPVHPPAHAEPALRAHLAALLDPPHYFTDATGYLSWVSALWEASCGWAGDELGRSALLGWRLRWLGVLAARAAAGGDEARRLRAEGRAAVRRHGPRDAHAHALLARLEARAHGAAAGARAALRAARAGVLAPAPVALHAARAARELCAPAAARRALVAAVLRRALPPDEELATPPPAADVAAALAECERRCAELERRWEKEEATDEGEGDGEGDGEWEGEDVWRALLPGEGEWAAARVALAPPARRAALERAALGAPPPRRAQPERYAEQQAVALALAAAAEGRLAQVAAAFLPRHPDCALLALAAAGAPAWAPPPAWPASDAASLARVAAALVRGAPPHAVARAAARAAPGGGAARWAVALGAAGAAGAERAALAATDELPHHKWTAVRAAAAAPALAAELADALLERELRVHALFEELTPSSHV